MSSVSKKIIEQMKRITNAHCKQIEQDNKDGLTSNEVALLDKIKLLSRKQKNITSELAKELNLSPPLISVMIKKLEGKEYVKRVLGENDRRNVYIELLPKSESVIETYNNYFKQYDKALDIESIDEIIKLLEKMSDYQNSYSMNINEKGKQE